MEKKVNGRRPKIHLTPAKNWCNDPNGFIYYKGQYHLFYQYFPYDTRWGTMHWNHATTTDFLQYADHGIALYPSKAYDANGCFSGSALEIDGRMEVFYTAVRYTDFDPEDIHVHNGLEACQAKITSENGLDFDNIASKRQIIPAGDYGSPEHTRDPKVWFDNDQYYMVLGSRYLDENFKPQGQLLFYVSQDGEDWHFCNVFRGFEAGDMWECPDLFSIDGQWFWISSFMNIEETGYENQVKIATIQFTPETCRMEVTSELSLLDEGRDLYAVQTTQDAHGNRIYTGWLRMPEAIDGFRGTFIMPRKLVFENGRMKTPVVDSIANAFSHDTLFSLEHPVKIECEMEEGGFLNIGGYVIKLEKGILYFDRSAVFPSDCEAVVKVGFENIRSVPLEIYVDGCVIEIFVQGGEIALAQIVYNLSNTFLFNIPISVKGLQPQMENQLHI